MVELEGGRRQRAFVNNNRWIKWHNSCLFEAGNNSKVLKGVHSNSMNCVEEFHFIKLSTACRIGAKNCLTIPIFIWLEAHNIKRLAQLRSVRKHSKDKDLPVVAIFDNLACTVCSMAIKDKQPP